MRSPDYQQGKRQDEVIQVERTKCAEACWAGGIAISHVFLPMVLKVLNHLLQDPLDRFFAMQTLGCCISGLGPGICILGKLLR